MLFKCKRIYLTTFRQKRILGLSLNYLKPKGNNLDKKELPYYPLLNHRIMKSKNYSWKRHLKSWSPTFNLAPTQCSSLNHVLTEPYPHEF